MEEHVCYIEICWLLPCRFLEEQQSGRPETGVKSKKGRKQRKRRAATPVEQQYSETDDDSFPDIIFQDVGAAQSSEDDFNATEANTGLVNPPEPRRTA